MDTHTISICSGYGGIELGLSAVVPGIRTVCYVEREIEVAQILAARIKDGVIDDAPVWTDLRTFDAAAWRGKVSLVTGGFPCQPHSVAGNRKGADDERELSGEVLRIAEELGYPTLFLENVPGIRRFYWDNIRPKLQSMGYRTEELLITAAETGAPHRRQRLFILADHDNTGDCSSRHGSEREGKKEVKERKNGSFLEPTGSSENVADNVRLGTQVQTDRKYAGKQVSRDEFEEVVPLYPPGPADTQGWEYVYDEMPALIPTFCRVANGPTPGVSRQLRAAGNGVVPAVAARAWQILNRRFLDE